MAYTVEVIDANGRFRLLNDDGTVAAEGHAVPSSQPGMVMLQIAWPPGANQRVAAIRVPISWLEQLQ